MIDVGLATIAAFVNKYDLSSIKTSDMDKVADYINDHYPQKPLQGFMQGSIFVNSGYTNPTMSAEARIESIKLRLFAYRGTADPTLPPCAICSSPASIRVERDYFPLLTGRDVINFYPDGEAGLPICGDCLLAVQAYPLGSAGLLVLVHSDNPKVTIHFAKSFLEQNRKHIQLAISTQDKASLRPEKTTYTLIIHTLLDAEFMREDREDTEPPFSVSVYILSNYGPNPSIRIHNLPSEVVTFLSRMQAADLSHDWNMIIQRAWEVALDKKAKKTEEAPFTPRKNYLYEDLFGLPDNARLFLRTYFLRMALKLAKMEPGDPRCNYSTKNETEIVSWRITQEFLRRIMHMEQDRIDQIRQMGDQLAEYVSAQNDKRFFQEFFLQNRYDFFRGQLLKANLAHVKRGNPPIIQFEPYIQVFEDGEELARSDWRLARDLVLIRMVEKLHSLNWFGKNPDALSDELLKPEEETE